jgi:peptidoglycan/LPS O-acetylase OafA/YrhL
MTYRRDIDGLRAVAVIAVVLFHFDYLAGGFVGVDIFFVISGYLITKMIHDEVNEGSFTIVNFYIRRIRRIFPAIFVLYFAVMVMTVLFTFSADAGDIGRSLISSVFFLSNIFFYRDSGYFEDGNALRPLLHTWSLSVEEQFYIVLPFLMIVLGGFALRVRRAVLWTIAAASLAASIWMVWADASAAFYLMQFRAWEFLAGSLLAVGAVPAIRRPDVAEWVAGFGLFLTCLSIAAMSRRFPFPGLGALAPCLGAALVIHAGRAHTTRVSRFLSLPAMVFIGLISYSLYLWHWPVRRFYGYIVATPGHTENILLILLSVSIAVLSWRYVETPFRRLKLEGRRLPVFAASAAVMTFIALLSMPLEPLVRTVTAEPAQITKTLSYIGHRRHDMRRGSCFLNSETIGLSQFDKTACLEPSKDKPNFLIIGDSHAAHLWAGLAGTYPDVHFLQATASGCRPLVNTGGKSRCTDLRNFVFDEFLPQHRLAGIILASRWRQGNVKSLKPTVDRLSRYADRVIVLGPIVEYRMALPRVLAKAFASGDWGLIDEYRRGGIKSLDEKIAAALQGAPAEFISLYDAICVPDCAVWAKEGVPLQFDYGHLTTDGSLEVAQRLRSRLFPGQKLTQQR